MQFSKTPVAHSDESFLFELYADSRSEEMSLVPWNEEQKLTFLKQQFYSQHNYYINKYPTASFQIILSGDEKIGRLYVSEDDENIKILDLTIASNRRNQGIGRRLLEEILSEAREKNKAVEIYLETNNRWQNLFAKLGFKAVAGDEIYQLWLWQNHSVTANKDEKETAEYNQAAA